MEVDIGQVPSSGNFDDGYEWRGPVKRHTVPVTTGPGQPPGGLEITQCFGGLWEENSLLSVLRVEYRLLVPNNRVFLVHYLLIDSAGAAVVPPDLAQAAAQGSGLAPQGTVNPSAVFQPLNPQAPPQQAAHMMKPVAPPKPAPLQSQPPRPKIATGKTAQPVSAVSHDDTANLIVDDDSVAKIDVAHARSKFVRGLMSRIFEEREPKLEAEIDEEVVALMEQQVKILTQEKQLFEDAAKRLVKANEKRRKALNGLFHSALESEDLDDLLSAWHQVAGYPAEPTAPIDTMEPIDTKDRIDTEMVM